LGVLIINFLTLYVTLTRIVGEPGQVDYIGRDAMVVDYGVIFRVELDE
jgi:hypothetical protein